MSCAVITGSARGLGYETAKAFASYGYNIVLSDVNEANLASAKEDLKKAYPQIEVLTVKCNVTVYDDLLSLWEKAAQAFSTVEIWINNAGVNQPEKPLYLLKPEEISFLLDIDLKGAIYGSTIAFGKMKEQGHGQIYNIEGFGSEDNFMTGLNLYGTSKRAVTHFTLALAKEAEELKTNIKVGRLAPGIMITSFIKNANGDKTKIQLSDKTKKVYNILGDYPDVPAAFFAKRIVKNTKNNVRFSWLTGRKAAWRFLTAPFNKRDFFKE